MENNETPGVNAEDIELSRLRELQKKQNSDAIWTEQNRQELLALQSKPKRVVENSLSEEEKRNLLHRQATANHNGEPPLTEMEMVNLQKLNRMR